MSVMHKHHIVPRYRCEELGIDPDFEENIVEVTREQHALIHWGYQCGDLEPLLEVCDPSPEILEMIALGDGRDSGAAVLLAQGEIDGIKTPKGKDSPAYKHGMSYNKEWNRDRWKLHYQENRDKKLEYQRQYNKDNKDKVRESRKKWHDKNPNYFKEWREENIEYDRERGKTYYQKNRDKKIEYQRQYRAKKKAEKLAQQTGATLPI